MEATFRAGIGLGDFRKPRVVLNRDGSVDGYLHIAAIPRHIGPRQLLTALAQSLLPVPGTRLLIDWKLGPARNKDELKDLEERYLPTRSSRMPWHVPTSYFGSSRWAESFVTAQRILSALKERRRSVVGLSINVYWDPEGRYRTARTKRPKPGYKRTWAWRPHRRKRR